ncbi:MAG: peptidoglycan DD-metalloendopeptidase family protein [Pricia sp.]|nr:peptidoglycan DD-metalloendopeptidase family protein [Pricia sp.]
MALDNKIISDPTICQRYIDEVINRNNAEVAYGGYLEKRNLYGGYTYFEQEGKHRNIHLGIDFWAKAGTKVLAPMHGVVHSFKNNARKGDYGPTIILQHVLNDFWFHTLYGHLSVESLVDIKIGMKFEKGNELGTLGTSDINVNYAPHLHFQIIVDMEGKKGDYPGVCARKDLEFYRENCPDPNMLLKMP